LAESVRHTGEYPRIREGIGKKGQTKPRKSMWGGSCRKGRDGAEGIGNSKENNYRGRTCGRTARGKEKKAKPMKRKNLDVSDKGKAKRGDG